MFTSCLAKITSIEGRILSVSPVGTMNGKKPPEIHGVPLGLIGNEQNHSDYKLNIGDIVAIFFTTFSLDDFVANGSDECNSSIGKNDYNSAFAIPITFNNQSMDLPESIRTVGNNIHKGNLNQEGTQDITGLCSSETDYVSAGVSGKNHSHKYNPGSNPPTDTAPPTKSAKEIGTGGML